MPMMAELKVCSFDIAKSLVENNERANLIDLIDAIMARMDDVSFCEWVIESANAVIEDLESTK